MEQLELSQAITPKPSLKHRIMAALDQTEDTIDLDNLPPTGKYSDHESWFKAVEHLIPAEPFDDFFAHVLQQNEKMAQALLKGEEPVSFISVCADTAQERLFYT